MILFDPRDRCALFYEESSLADFQRALFPEIQEVVPFFRITAIILGKEDLVLHCKSSPPAAYAHSTRQRARARTHGTLGIRERLGRRG